MITIYICLYLIFGVGFCLGNYLAKPQNFSDLTGLMSIFILGLVLWPIGVCLRLYYIFKRRK